MAKICHVCPPHRPSHPSIQPMPTKPGQKRLQLRVLQRPLTLILLQQLRDTNGRRIVIQVGGVYTTFFQVLGILCKNIAIEMGRVSILFKSIGVRGRFDSPGQRAHKNTFFVGMSAEAQELILVHLHSWWQRGRLEGGLT